MPASPSSTRPSASLTAVPSEPTVFGPRHWLLLLAITVLAGVVRVWCLGEWSIWVDEAHTWRDATMPLLGEHFANGSFAPGFLDSARRYYPLTFLLLRGLIAAGLPESEGWLRLPFALVGVLTVPLLAVCGRRLVGAWPAVFAALLLAIHPWHVHWSQNARGYVFVVFAAVVTADRLHAWVRHDRLRDFAAIVAAVALAAASHTTGAVLGLAVGTFLLLRRRPFDRRWLVMVLVLAAFTVWGLPWLIETWQLFPEFQRSKDSPSLVHFVQTTGFYFRPLVLVAAAVGLWLLRHVGGRDRALALANLSIVPLLALFAIGAQLVLTTARYAICVLPIVTWLSAFAALQVARAVGRLPARSRPAALCCAAVVPLLLVGEHSAGLVDYYTVQSGQRARWREAAALLRARAAGQPVRVSTINHPTLLYYLRPGHWAGQVPPEYAANQVVPLIDWMYRGGQTHNKVEVHTPGARQHLAWHRAEARRSKALFALVATLPELVEQDSEGELREALALDCELIAYLPCWVGPKDESIHVWVLKEP